MSTRTRVGAARRGTVMRGWKITNPLGQTHNGFRWPIVPKGAPPVRVETSGPFTNGECPAHEGDGLCLARTCTGAQSGGVRLADALLMVVEYDAADVLSDGTDKYRVKACSVVETLVAVDVIRRGEWTATTGADLTGARLRGADLRGACLRRADLWGANLWRADLWRADLCGADLRRADLRRADLTRANLWGADLREACLRAAYLRGANLRAANLTGANLWGATANRYTVWPEGFDPVAAGVKQ